jgi:hypothetical protein
MTHTGLVTAPQGLDAGSTVPIWIDRSGAAVPEPMSARDALGMAGITAGLVILAGVMVLAVLWAILGRVLMASNPPLTNSAAWEQNGVRSPRCGAAARAGAADQRSSRQAPRSTASWCAA